MQPDVCIFSMRTMGDCSSSRCGRGNGRWRVRGRRRDLRRRRGTFDAVVGLLVFPLAVSGVVLLRGRNASAIRLTGAEGHCANCALIAAAFILVPVAALLFMALRCS
jgi:hypothetical protein